MAKKIVKIWYDQVMEKVDSKGNILGFSVLKVSQLRKRPLDVALS